MFEFQLPKKKFKNEKEFTTWFGQQIKKNGGFRHKISDMDIGYKPADAIVSYRGNQYLIEFKVGNEKRKVDVFKKLRYNQIEGLSKWSWNGGISLVVYYSKTYHRYYIKRFLSNTKEIIINLPYQNKAPEEN